MIPLGSKNTVLGEGEKPSKISVETETSPIDSSIADLANQLVISLQVHATPSKSFVSNADRSQNIYLINEIHVIHEDCVNIHRLCQNILSSSIPLIKKNKLLKMRDFLSTIERQLMQQNTQLGNLEEVRNEIIELENVIGWTEQISRMPDSSGKRKKTFQSPQSFWKTLLKATVFSSLVWNGSAIQNDAQKVQPLEHEPLAPTNLLDSHQFNHLTPPFTEEAYASLEPLAIHVAQTGQHLISLNSTCEPSQPAVWTNPPSTSWIQDSAEIQYLDNFVSNSSIPIDNQLLLHIIGDTYGKMTSLDGGDTVKNLEYLLKIIEQELYHLDQNPACSGEEREQFCKALFEGTEIQGAVFSKPTLENLQEQIKRAITVGEMLRDKLSHFYNAAISQVKHLNSIGDSFFFPVHWPQHALACEIIKEAEDSYAVRIYNTGEGSESYSELYTPTGVKRLPFVEVTDVRLKKLEDRVFYNALWSLSAVEQVRDPQKTLYQQILPILEGVPSNRSYSVEEHLKPQKSGTCSMRALSGVLCQLLGNTQQCQQLNWKLGLKALSDFHQQHINVLETDIISLNNLRKGLSEFAVLSKELMGNNLITVNAFRYASDTTEKISKALDASEMNYEKLQREKRLGCEITTAPPVLPPSMTLAEYQSNWSTTFSLPKPLESEIQFGTVPAFTTSHLITELQGMLTQLDLLMNHTAMTASAITYCYELAMQIIQGLPSPTSDFWSSLSMDDVSIAIEKLTDLEFELAFSVNSYAHTDSLRTLFNPADATITVMKLIAIMDSLGQRVPEGELPMPNLYQKSFGEIYKSRNPLISKLSPVAIGQLEDIKKYWEKRQPNGDIDLDFVSSFGIEAMPPSNLDGRYGFCGFMLLADNKLIREEHGTIGSETDKKKFRDWEFQKWAENYLIRHPEKHTELKSSLCKKSPQWADKFDNLKRATIYTLADSITFPVGTARWDRGFKTQALERFLPSNFYRLRDASFIADYFFRGFLGSASIEIQSREKRLFFNLSPSYYSRDEWSPGDEFKVDVVHKFYSDIEDVRWKRGEGWNSNWFGSEYKASYPQDIGQPSARRLAPNKEIKQIWSEWPSVRRRPSLEDINTKGLSDLGFSKETIEKYGIEKLRSLLMLSALPDVQISRTISYFSQHTDFLETSDGQWLMEHLILEPLVLRETLRQDPAQVKLLLTPFKNFFDQQYDQVKISMSDSQVLFLVRLNRQLQQEVNHIYAKNPEMLQFIPDVKEKISILLQSSATSDALKVALNQELAISCAYTNKWEKNSIAQFLIAHVAASSSNGINPLVDKLSCIEQEESFNLQLQKIAPYFENKASRELLLNQIIKANLPHIPSNIDWEPHNAFPLFKGTIKGSDAELCIDLLSGRIWDNTGSVTSLPTSAAIHPTIAALGKKHPNAAITSPGSDQWYLTTPQGEQYRFQKIEKTIQWRDPVITFVVQKKIQDEWYQLDETQKLSIPTLTRDKTQWVLKNEKGDGKILIEDATSGKPFAFGFLNSSDNKFKIFKADEAGKLTTQIYEDVSQSESQLHFLTDIESAHEILFWRDQATGAPKEVTLPRLGLQFRASEQNGKIVFISDELGGYTIAKEQSLDALADAMHYLVLEKGKEKKALIPRIHYSTPSASSLNPISTLDNSAGSNYRYFLYDVQPNQSKASAEMQLETQLLPPSREARLFLSMIHLWHHNYEKALQLLVGHGGQQERYKAEEREILRWIGELDKRNKDSTPEADAVRMQARILLMRNERNFGFTEKSIFEDKDFLKECLLAYEKHLSHPSPWGQFQIQPDDEHFFLREFLSLYPKDAFIDLIKTTFTSEIGTSLHQALDRRLGELKGMATKVPKITVTKPYPASPPLPHTNVLYNYDAIKGCLIRDHDRELSSNIIKPVFGKELSEFYEIVRMRLPRYLQTMLQKITGTDLYHSLETEEELTAVLDKVLEFISNRPMTGEQNYDDTSTIARFLRNILNYPDAAINLPAHFPIEMDSDWRYPALSQHTKQLLQNIYDTTPRSNALPRLKELTQSVEPARQAVVVPEESSSLVKSRPIYSLTNPQILTVPRIPELAEFHIDTASAGQLMTLNSPASQNATREELANDLNFTTNNTVANRVITKLHEEISEYEGPAKAQEYSIKDWPSLKVLNTTLSQEYTANDAMLNTLTQQIENLIQKEPADPAERAYHRLEVAVKRKNPLNIDDAVYLYLKRSTESFKELNPTLDEADQNAFMALMHRYLIESTNQQHRSRLLKGISDIDDMQRTKGFDAVPQKLKDSLGRALFSQRAYDPLEHPEYLVLEHFMDILLWDKQVKALDTLLIKEGAITAPENLGAAMELIMGSGKTDVLLPLICLLNANGENLALGIVPKVLLAENAAELSERVGSAFRQVLDVVKINQDIRLDLKGLVNLHDRLQYAIRNRRIVMMSDSDVQGLFLKFADASMDAAQLQGNELQAKLQEIAEFRKIFRLFHTRGVPAIDEPDTIFNAKLSQHQTKGSSQRLPQSFVGGTRAFMLALGNQASNAGLFQEQEEIANHIAGVAIHENRGIPFEKNSQMATYLNGLSSDERKTVAAFLKGSSEPAVLKFIDDITKKFDEKKLITGETIQDILSVIREQISTLAPLIFSKKYRFDFAPPVPEEELDQVDKVEDLFSIPYKKGTPSLGSKPGTELEEILYTYRQFLLRKRLPKTFFKNIAEDLRRNTISISTSMRERLEDIPAYKELSLLFGDKLPTSLNQPFSDELIETVITAIEPNTECLTDFIDKYIIKEIQFYPVQINSNAQFYRFLFKKGSETAFSGTVWNGESWPWLFGDDLHLSDTAQKTLTLMYQGPDKTVHSISIAGATTVTEALNEIYTKIPESTSIIDGSGDLLRFDPKEVARGMLAQDSLSKKLAARYPDKETGFWMELERGKTEPILVEQSKLSPSQVAVYWPSPKTTGSDVRTAPDEVAVVILGQNTILRDIQQTLWRLREYDKGQTARFAMDSENEAVVRLNLGLVTGHPITGNLQIKHTLQNAVYTQAMQVGDDNTRSLKSRLNAAMMHRVWDNMLDPALPDQGVVDLMWEAQPLYVSNTLTRPYHMYGKTKALRPREEVTQEWLNKALKNPVLAALDPAQQESAVDEMRKTHQKATPSLPSHLLVAKHFGFEHEVQKEVRKEKEVLKETLTQTQTEVDTLKDYSEPLPKDWKVDLFPWKDEGLFTEGYFSNLIDLATTTYISNLISGKRDMYGSLNTESHPIVPLNIFVGAAEEPGDFSPNYSQNLLSSVNLSPIHKRPHPLAVPYSRVQEYPRVFIVIQTETGLQSMLITENEEKRFRELLSNDRTNKGSGKREVKIALYDLETGVAAQSSDPIDFTSLEKDREFLMQKVQLKFYAGMSHYSKVEVPALREWIQKCGEENMHHYFTSIVLTKERTDSRKAYMHSALKTVFEELGV